ncbi:hypothetical protein [Parerythrobacter aestuarii]|uniref:hypothetical protein n=1 Tax=Parerythrobacter aestuarii TaxID=3020909 RepID=UPI0024DE1F47|nr:hypothetical protein [Parerythrobacter aestuarii]
MIDNLPAVFAAYSGGSAAISYIMAKASPTISTRVRSLFAGFAPLAVIYGEELVREDSVALTGADLLSVGGLVLVGTGIATLVGRQATRKPTPEGLPRIER